MGFLDYVFAGPPPERMASSAPTTMGGAPGIDGLGVGGGGKGMPSDISTVYSIIKAMSGMMGTLPRAVVNREGRGRQEDRRPELRHLWGRPNLDRSPMGHGVPFWTGAFASCVGWSNGYAWQDRVMPPRGDPERDWRAVRNLYYLPPWHVTPHASGDGDAYYTLGIDMDHHYHEGEILHFMSPPAPNGLRGLTPVEVSRGAHLLAADLERSGVSMLRHGSLLSGVVGVDDDVTKELYDEFQKDWQENYAGSSRTGKVALLGRGAKFTPVSIPPADAQYLEGRTYQREELLGMYAAGWPHHLLSWPSNTSNFGTGIEAQGRHLVQFVLVNRLRIVEAMVDDMLLPPDLSFKFNVDGLQRGDQKSRADTFHKMRLDGTMSADEWREMEDMAARSIPDDFLSPKNTERIDAISGEALGVPAKGGALPPPAPPNAPGVPGPVPAGELATAQNCVSASCVGGVVMTSRGESTGWCHKCGTLYPLQNGHSVRDTSDLVEAFLDEVQRRL